LDRRATKKRRFLPLLAAFLSVVVAMCSCALNTTNTQKSYKYFAYVENSSSCDASAYSIGSDGKLTQLAGSPFPALASGFPASVAASPNGSFLYVVLHGNQVDGYSIGTGGGLTPLTGSPFTAGTSPLGIAVAAVLQP
jgi:6-phosphogluconolactonase (cycloisomerase 2 family)